ncbi:monocarboxylate transporter 14 [Plakobranchus ocellatus]|uniref:Monocarboxylate transporter 14 n=1 Tax=Plakobranchus ocellatus TaxID=259542 RepID=A0AAV3Z4U4_9GAST|nr:monocarboxylate transporter 14 [Plakobranchus ocellatus]
MAFKDDPYPWGGQKQLRKKERCQAKQCKVLAPRISTSMEEAGEDKKGLMTLGPEADHIEPADNEDGQPDKETSATKRDALQLVEKGPTVSIPEERRHSIPETSSFIIHPDSDYHSMIPETQDIMEEKEEEESPDEDKGIEMTMTMSVEEADENVQDRGFAWVIVFGGLLTQVLSGGLSRTNSLFYGQFLDRFGKSSQLTSWPGAVSFLLQGFVAPFASWFSSRYSVRSAVIMGTLFIMAGLVITAYAPNIYVLFVSYSVLQGIGRGLVLSSGVFIINMYFDKYRGIALGVASTGTGIGTFALAPLFERLFNTLGYRDTMLAITGMSTIGLVAAATFRPLSVHKRMIKERRRRRIESHVESSYGAEEAPLASYGAMDGALKNNDGSGVTTSETSLINGATVKSEPRKNRAKTVVVEQRSCFRAIIETVFPVEGVKGKKKKRKPFFHWALLKDFPFIVLCISMTFFNLAHKTVFAFLVVTCEEQGLTDIEAAYVLSLSGVGDIAGRLIVGFLMDLPKLRPIRNINYTLLLFVASGAALMVPFSKTLVLLGIAGALYGGVAGSSVSQRSTVLAALLGKEMVNSAYGILDSIQAVGTLAGPPIAGALKDEFDTYRLAFFLSSGSMALAALLLALSSLLFYIRKRRSGSVKYQRLPEETPVSINSPTSADKADRSLGEREPLR